MNILIAVDGSKHTQKTLGYLLKHRAMFVDGHDLILVHVCTSLPGHVTRHLSREVVTEYYDEENIKVIEPARAFLQAQSITGFRTEQRHGHAAEEILKSAAANHVELIVMGTHGHGIFGRALMGSVATKVISETNTTVLLVQ